MQSDYLNSTDSEIWSDFKKGSETAFSFIYQQYSAALFSYGFHIARDSEVVKDCIQNLFISLWSRRGQLGDTNSIKFYLFKSLRRAIVDELMAKSRYSTLEELEEYYDFEVTMSHEFKLIADQTTLEQREKLHQALDSLTNRQKEAIYLIYFNNLSHQETATVMALKVTAVYNLVYHALTTLKKLVTQIGLCLLLTELFY